MKITRRYLAGLLDGEGYFGIVAHKRADCTDGVNYVHAIKMASTNEEIITLLKEQFGGYVHYRVMDGNRKNAWSWEVKTFTQVTRVLDYVYPYLIIKRRPAEILKEFLDSKANSNKSHLTKKELDKRKRLYEAIRILNFRGIPPATTE